MLPPVRNTSRPARCRRLTRKFQPKARVQTVRSGVVRKQIYLAAALQMIFSWVLPAQSTVLFQTTTPPSTGMMMSGLISPTHLVGNYFVLNAPAHVDSIGLAASVSTPGDTIFGAILSVPDLSTLPTRLQQSVTSWLSRGSIQLRSTRSSKPQSKPPSQWFQVEWIFRQAPTLWFSARGSLPPPRTRRTWTPLTAPPPRPRVPPKWSTGRFVAMLQPPAGPLRPGLLLRSISWSPEDRLSRLPTASPA